MAGCYGEYLIFIYSLDGDGEGTASTVWYMFSSKENNAYC